MRTNLITSYAIAFVVGIITSYYFSLSLLTSIVLLMIVGTVFVIQLIRKQVLWSRLLMVSIIFLLGCLNLSVNNYFIQKDTIVLADNYSYIIQTDPTKTNYGFKCHALVQNVLVELHVTTEKPIRYGDVICSKTAPYFPEKPLLFETFDKPFFLLQSKIKYMVYVNQFTVQSSNNSNYFLAQAYAFRHQLEQRIDTHLATPHNSILKALVLGLRSDIPKEIKKQFTETGTIHVLAVSGLHVGIIYLILTFLIRRFKWSHIVIVLFLCCFAALTGFSYSVVRAVIFLTVIELGKMMGKKSKLSQTLSFTVILLLSLNPYSIFNIGFQLSFTAVIGIILFMPFFEPLYRYQHPILKYIYDTIAVSISVKLSLTPILLYHFHTYTPASMIGNIFVMPYTFLILIFSIPFLALPSYFTLIMDNLIYSLLFYLELISDWINIFVTGISFSAYQCIVCYLMVWCVYGLFQKVKFYKLALLTFFVFCWSVLTVFTTHNEHHQTEMYYLVAHRYNYLVCNDKGSLSYIPLKEDFNFEKYIYQNMLSEKGIINMGEHPYKQIDESHLAFKFAEATYLLNTDKMLLQKVKTYH